MQDVNGIHVELADYNEAPDEDDESPSPDPEEKKKQKVDKKATKK